MFVRPNPGLSTQSRAKATRGDVNRRSRAHEGSEGQVSQTYMGLVAKLGPASR